jgi:hypothetical protein
VYFGYLNEIISHKRSAVDAATHAGADFESVARSEVLFHGASNVNVFTGAYVRAIDAGAAPGFAEFVQKVAPYRLESELRRTLLSKGFVVVDSLKDSTYAALYSMLERSNAKKLASGKEPILLEHDALQLRLLEADRGKGERSLFVTADRRLYDDVSAKEFVHLRDSMMSHIGLLQFIDLVVGLKADKRQIGALLWSNTISDRTQKIRSHLVAEALEQYDAAMTMGMHQIVEAHADRIVRELERTATDLETQSPRKRIFQEYARSHGEDRIRTQVRISIAAFVLLSLPADILLRSRIKRDRVWKPVEPSATKAAVTAHGLRLFRSLVFLGGSNGRAQALPAFARGFTVFQPVRAAALIWKWVRRL